MDITLTYQDQNLLTKIAVIFLIFHILDRLEQRSYDRKMDEKILAESYKPENFEGGYIYDAATGRPLISEDASDAMQFLADYIEAYNKNKLKH